MLATRRRQIVVGALDLCQSPLLLFLAAIGKNTRACQNDINAVSDFVTATTTKVEETSTTTSDKVIVKLTTAESLREVTNAVVKIPTDTASAKKLQLFYDTSFL